MKNAGKDPCDIITMDQTPILYLFHSNKTLKNKVVRSIHVCPLTSHTKRVTLAITLDASGSMLPPMLIFKGMQNGCIAIKAFLTCSVDGQY